jgi:hypothetical protein
MEVFVEMLLLPWSDRSGGGGMLMVNAFATSIFIHMVLGVLEYIE